VLISPRIHKLHDKDRRDGSERWICSPGRDLWEILEDGWPKGVRAVHEPYVQKLVLGRKGSKKRKGLPKA